MEIVLLTALGVGGATVVGALLGFAFKKMTHTFSDIVLSFAAGVMLSAAVIGLILPSLEKGGKFAVPITIVGVFCGALALNLIDRLVPHLHRLVGVDQESHPEGTDRVSKIMLFVLAIAIHNFPEGIAAGVGFGSGSSAENRFINLVNARLSGSCKRSFPSVSSKAPSGLRIRCRMISTATKAV